MNPKSFDAVSLGIMWDRLVSLVDAIVSTLLRTSFSTIVNESYDLTCVVPLRFQVTSQPKTSDGHVYGGRSRFLTEKLVKCFDESAFQGTNVEVKIEESAADSGTIDVASRLKQMW